MFMTTASEGEEGDISWLDNDRQPLLDAGLNVFDYSVTNKTPIEVAEALQTVSAVCVAGGDTYYLLDHIKKSGFDTIITRLVKEGMPYIGSSAGPIVAGPTIETSLDDPSIAPDLTDFTGLNLCSLSVRPHWGSTYFIDRYKKEFERLYSLNSPILLLTDNEYLVVENDLYAVKSI